MYGKWASSSPIISDSLSPAGSTSSKRKQFGSVWHTGLFTAPSHFDAKQQGPLAASELQAVPGIQASELGD